MEFWKAMLPKLVKNFDSFEIYDTDCNFDVSQNWNSKEQKPSLQFVPFSGTDKNLVVLFGVLFSVKFSKVFRS